MLGAAAIGGVGYVTLSGPHQPSAAALSDSAATSSRGSGTAHGTAATTPPANAPLPSGTPTFSSALGRWGHITSRADDEAPLTLHELYPARFLIDGSSFVRTAERADARCGRALLGTRLLSAARKADCSQVLRASYTSTDQQLMGTIGVVNLTSATAAVTVGKVTGARDLVRPLDGTNGPTRELTKGTGVVQSVDKGHYLILTFAELADGHRPSAAGRRRLETFSTDLVSGTANIALSTRMVTGKR